MKNPILDFRKETEKETKYNSKEVSKIFTTMITKTRESIDTTEHS